MEIKSPTIKPQSTVDVQSLELQPRFPVVRPATGVSYSYDLNSSNGRSRKIKRKGNLRSKYRHVLSGPDAHLRGNFVICEIACSISASNLRAASGLCSRSQSNDASYSAAASS